MRLDKFIVDNKLVNSRNKAQHLITNGCVLVNNIIVNNKHYEINENDVVIVNDVGQYVSRGAYKLLHALTTWKINLTDQVVLDIGASTGGFTQVCLNMNALKVYAVDVGTNQIDKKLKENKKIVVYEQTNFKTLVLSMFEEKIDYIVADLSFISLTTLIEKINQLFNYPLKMIFLIKPQFELGKDVVSRFNGVIREPKLWNKAVGKIKQSVIKHNFKINGIIPSPIKGNSGNTEFLIYCEKK
ncbi:hemolysin A [Candidatus Malacoplasma girerdii]|uniref:Hemolysin A n=1 Tax=Candidatus Malacoplasma girerdii TaxID=1318617 RepID=A0A097STB7_9BACT|nr:hemolysin A [Candidatus Malacoplasma girerdii]ASJ89331.1 MAG: 16S/23S rRNA (cytidine-2'-O)-methyltransferase TlyA/hemolysin A [Candidatus Malacoplasma girerdii]